MSEQTPLSADKRYPIEIIQGVEGFCIGVNNYRLVGPKPWGGGTVVKRWNVSLADLGRAIPELSATIDAQATEIAALRRALDAKEREMLAEHSSAMQALLRWCGEDTPEDIRKGWEQESHEALRALAAGRPR